jgi:hypothetical protein
MVKHTCNGESARAPIREQGLGFPSPRTVPTLHATSSLHVSSITSAGGCAPLHAAPGPRSLPQLGAPTSGPDHVPRELCCTTNLSRP